MARRRGVGYLSESKLSLVQTLHAKVRLSFRFATREPEQLGIALVRLNRPAQGAQQAQQETQLGGVAQRRIR